MDEHGMRPDMDEHGMRRPGEVGPGGFSTLQLRVDRATGEADAPGRTLYCTGVDGTELRVAVDEGPDAERSWTTGQWYSFDGIARSRTHRAELLLSPDDGRAERTDTPEHGAHYSPAAVEEPWLIQLGTNDEVLGVTVGLRPSDGRRRARADDPGSFEVGAVCLAPCGGADEATVYHREDSDTRDEHLLLQHVTDDLSENKGATLVTHGTTRLPLEMLRARLDRAAGGDVVDSGAAQVLDGCFHANLARVAARRGVETLWSAAERLGIEVSPVLVDDYDIGLAPADWREGWNTDDSPPSGDSDPRMTDRDYATLVQRYLDAADESPEVMELAQCLKAHVRAEWSLLREVVASGAVDRLACSRLARPRAR